MTTEDHVKDKPIIMESVFTPYTSFQTWMPYSFQLHQRLFMAYHYKSTLYNLLRSINAISSMCCLFF